MEIYTYSNRETLYDRRRYSYAPYHGVALLTAWKGDRGLALEKLPRPAEAPPPCQPQPLLWEQEEWTDNILENLWVWVENESGLEDSEAELLLDRLTSKFEVTKRLHDAYQANFRAVDKEAHNSVGLYLRFAEILERDYSRSGHLVRLNVYLKVMDSLLARREDLDEPEQSRLARLIRAEAVHIRELATSMEVSAWLS